VAPSGIGKEDFWKANIEGVSAVDKIRSFDTADYATKIAAEIKNFDPQKYLSQKLIDNIDRSTQFALVAAKLAIEDAGINLEKDNKNSIGVCIGAGLGGMFFYEKQIIAVYENSVKKIEPACVPRITPNAPSSQISIQNGLLGPNITVSTACSSGGHALGLAMDMIKLERADVILAGGTEASIIPLTFGAFSVLRVMSRRNDTPKEASRPFDKDRDGFVMGEGSAILILEELSHAKNRKANIYAELIGYGSTSGAYHMAAPEPKGKDAIRAMKIALNTAEINPQDVDYINAHGTSTKANDKVETEAIKAVFKEHAYKLAVSSTKSMIGHPIGAAGAVEAVVSVLAIQHNIAPPTINYKTPDPDCDLNYVPNQAQKRKIDTVLSNSFGFGSNNAVLVFRRFTE
jgi:3-oxoacyl-[acyl-carrier-protein] synthase II